MKRPIAILYEHPEWFKPLFAALDDRAADYVALDATGHSYDPDDPDVPYSLVVNRMIPSAWMRGHRDAIFHTLRYLEHLEDLGAPVLNGAPSASSCRRRRSTRSWRASAYASRPPAC